MAKVKKYGLGGMLGGVVPRILTGGGKNAGFGLGVLPGLLYRGYKDHEEEEEKAKKVAAAEQEAKAAAASGMKKGGKVSSASKRADGIATKGKTRGKIY